MTKTTPVRCKSARRAAVLYPGTAIGRGSQSHAEYPRNLTAPSKFVLLNPCSCNSPVRLSTRSTTEFTPQSQSSYPLPSHREGPDALRFRPFRCRPEGAFFLATYGRRGSGGINPPMNPMNLRQNQTFAQPRPLLHHEFRATTPPPRHEPMPAEHDFLVQNWRPDLVNETQRDQTFFTVDRP